MYFLIWIFQNLLLFQRKLRTWSGNGFWLLNIYVFVLSILILIRWNLIIYIQLFYLIIIIYLKLIVLYFLFIISILVVFVYVILIWLLLFLIIVVIVGILVIVIWLSRWRVRIWWVLEFECLYVCKRLGWLWIVSLKFLHNLSINLI